MFVGQEGKRNVFHSSVDNSEPFLIRISFNLNNERTIYHSLTKEDNELVLIQKNRDNIYVKCQILDNTKIFDKSLI